MRMESNNFKASLLEDAFINERDINQVLNYKDVVMGISVDDIKRVAREYLREITLPFTMKRASRIRVRRLRSLTISPSSLP